MYPAVGSRLMRDPSITRGPDGMFHLVWTTGWWDKGIGIAHSTNPIDWSEQSYLPVMADKPDALNCWAPEIFFDEETGRWSDGHDRSRQGRGRGLHDRGGNRSRR